MTLKEKIEEKIDDYSNNIDSPDYFGEPIGSNYIRIKLLNWVLSEMGKANCNNCERQRHCNQEILLESGMSEINYCSRWSTKK